jgi:hypothetical protein
MDAAHDVQFGRSRSLGLSRFAQDLIDCQLESAILPRPAAKGAKPAGAPANVAIIDMSINVVKTPVTMQPFFGQIGPPAKVM